MCEQGESRPGGGGGGGGLFLDAREEMRETRKAGGREKKRQKRAGVVCAKWRKVDEADEGANVVGPEAAILLCRVETGAHRGTPSLLFPGRGLTLSFKAGKCRAGQD